MAVKMLSLEDLLNEVSAYYGQTGTAALPFAQIAKNPVRIQGLHRRVPITYGSSKEQFQIMHISFEVHVTAKLKGEIFRYVEAVGMIEEHEDKRRIKNLQAKSVKREREIEQAVREKGLLMEKGIYEGANGK
jgi:hypothetical protein